MKILTMNKIQKTIQELTETYTKMLIFLNKIKDIEGVRQANLSGNIFMEDCASYRDIIKKVEELSAVLEPKLVLTNYYLVLGNLALSYHTSDSGGYDFVFYCKEVEEALTMLGCKIEEVKEETTERRVVCETKR